MSQAKFAEHLRRDCLELVADFLEASYCGRSPRGSRPGSPPGAPCDRPGDDLLYSYVKLQASNLNHWARLGLAQTEYARHLMDAWYAGACPAPCGSERTGRRGHSGEPVHVKAESKKEATEKFFVRNTSDKKTTLSFRTSCFSVPGQNSFNHDVKFDPEAIELEAGRADAITLKVTPGDAFLKGCCHRAVIDVLDGGTVLEQRELIVEVH